MRGGLRQRYVPFLLQGLASAFWLLIRTRSVYLTYLDISNKFTKLQAAYNRERNGNERLTNRLEEVLEENQELRIVAVDFGRIKAVVGSEQVNAVINRAKQQEQIEAEQKRATRRKHNREPR